MEGYRRNGEYPYKGIDTGYTLRLQHLLLLVEMENTRIRELTHDLSDEVTMRTSSRNGEYPYKGIDTVYLSESLQFGHFVEMENTRIRELTQVISKSKSIAPTTVEMENTRIRELTHIIYTSCKQIVIGRNGEYPFKGIDTQSGRI